MEIYLVIITTLLAVALVIVAFAIQRGIDKLRTRVSELNDDINETDCAACATQETVKELAEHVKDLTHQVRHISSVPSDDNDFTGDQL